MAAETPVKCSLVVKSEPSALGKPCRQILATLNAQGYSQDDLFAVHLALEEAFLNAVKHGNKMDATKRVTVEYSVDQEKVEISITDEGDGFDPRGIPDPRVGANLYRPEGRGLLLMGAYMHVVEYNSRGNSLHMVRYKGRPAPERSSPPAG
ncbi:MAG TPA: ATP-binding protein [Sedimentisphaerales bacterium]|jgi:serine/threonine-protein kinase RsbW|nr:ATP-binding protein [Sedimentisphaerales bacterium]HNU30751.1 ATP-binding protein [Sedimentisphaerales bacterium]